MPTHSHYWARIVAGILLNFLAICSTAHAFFPFGSDGIDYTVHLQGANTEMRAWLASLHLDEKTETNPPTNAEELDAEASLLADKVKRALAAKGYMEAVVEPLVDHHAEPPEVKLHIEQGARYTLTDISLRWQDRALKPIATELLKSKSGQPLDMAAIEKDTVALHDMIAEDTCLLSLSVTPRLRLYSSSRTAQVIFTIEHGASANFGASIITGNTNVHREVIERATAWQEGECYEAQKVDKTRSTLIESQLFASVEIEPASQPASNGRVPMHITVKERVARTVGAGIEYSTDRGMGVYGSWEHRNLLGKAEKLTSKLGIAESQQELEGILTIPAFVRDDQVLVISSSLEREILDAYEALTFDNSVGIERRISKHWKAGLGVGYSISETKDALNGTNQYALLSLPGFVEYDNRDNVIDARHGMLGRISATPYTETLGDGGQFLKLQGTGHYYLSSDTLPWKPTLATRLSLGAIYGADDDSVPADIRYYAGGGGSVRGYSYQSLSPYFNGDPIGGSSLVEMSSELRLRVTEQFGGVLFVDAGNAYSTTTPDFSEKLYVGVGTGVRYYSPIGPLRFDIGFPINGNDIGEDGYQFYVSLGQAF